MQVEYLANLKLLFLLVNPTSQGGQLVDEENYHLLRKLVLTFVM